MKLVERQEVLDLARYETIRDRFRARVIDEKKVRRVMLGSNASCVFENHDTVLLQIQEMLRTERITRESSVLHEIETYNQLVPAAHELSATIMIEIENTTERDQFLVEAVGLEKRFAVVIAGERCEGTSEARTDQNRTTAVHYVKFPLTAHAERALLDVVERKRRPNEIEAALVCEHPRYLARADFVPALVMSLAEDLT